MFSVVPQDRQRRMRPLSLIRGYGVAERVMMLSTPVHFETVVHIIMSTRCPSKGPIDVLSFQP
jgi:hypothetical protein